MGHGESENRKTGAAFPGTAVIGQPNSGFRVSGYSFRGFFRAWDLSLRPKLMIFRKFSEKLYYFLLEYEMFVLGYNDWK